MIPSRAEDSQSLAVSGSYFRLNQAMAARLQLVRLKVINLFEEPPRQPTKLVLRKTFSFGS